MTTPYKLPAPRRAIAFDPGETWCGIAALDWDNQDHEVVAESRVLRMTNRSLLEFLRYVDFMLPAFVICEDFRVQSVGHNRFSAGQTLRLIGALNAITALNPKSRWSLVPPGNAKKEVPELFGGWYEAWESAYPTDPGDNWRHAKSAWRVMGRFLWTTKMPLLQQLRCAHASQMGRIKPWLGSDGFRHGDLQAPALRTILTRP